MKRNVRLQGDTTKNILDYLLCLLDARLYKSYCTSISGLWNVKNRPNTSACFTIPDQWGKIYWVTHTPTQLKTDFQTHVWIAILRMPAYTATLSNFYNAFKMQKINSSREINLMTVSHTVHFLNRSLYLNDFPMNNDGSSAGCVHASSEQMQLGWMGILTDHSQSISVISVR